MIRFSLAPRLLGAPVLAGALAASLALAAPAAAVPSSLQVLVLGSELFLSPPSAQAAAESDNDLLVDVFDDRVEVTESSSEVTLVENPGSFNEATCTGGATLVCTNPVNRVVVQTEAGDDTIRWDEPGDRQISIDLDCGPGDRDRFFAVSGTGDPAIERTANCEYVEVNGVVVVDVLPDDPDPDPDPVAEPFADDDGLMVVARDKVDFAPTCGKGRTGCGGFSFTSLAAARTALVRSGLNYRLNLVRVTDYKKALGILEPFKKDGTVDTITNFVSGQVLAQKDVVDKKVYKRFRVKGSQRMSTLTIPYQLTLTYYEEPVPDPDGQCPYATGIYKDVDPRTKGKQEYDVVRELAGAPGRGQGVTIPFALDALEKRFGCSGVTVVRRPDPARPVGSAGSSVTDVVFDNTAKTVTVLADVTARSDLLLQVSGRSRSFWLDSPANVDLFEADLGPLVNGTLAVSPSNRTTVSITTFERATGRTVVGVGETLVLGPSGEVLASQASDGEGQSTLSFTVSESGPITFLTTITLPDGRVVTGYAVRTAMDASDTIVTTRGAVFVRDGAGVYQRNTTTPLTGTVLGATQGAMERLRSVLRGAPDGTAAGAARAIIEANYARISDKPAAVLRAVHEQTGYELASLHQNVTTRTDDPNRVADAVPGAVVLLSTPVTTATGTTGKFVSAVRPSQAGVTAVAASPGSTMLGGNAVLGTDSGGLVANGEWIVDQAGAPAQRTAARRGIGEWFSAIVRDVSTKVGEALRRLAGSKRDSGRSVAASYTGGSGKTQTATVGGVPVIVPQALGSIGTSLPLAVVPIPASSLGGAIIAGGAGNALPTLQQGSGGLIGNDGAGLIANDGSSLIANDGAGIVAGARVSADGLRLLANDGASLLANDGASLLANDGGSLRSSIPANLVPRDGASLLANDGASLIANDGAGIIAGGAGN